MRYISPLTDEERAALEEGWRNGKKHHFRNRCHSILLSAESYTVPEIAKFMKTRSRTIYTWFNNWEESGLSGLGIQPGRGVKAKLDRLNTNQVSQVKEEIRSNPQSLLQVCEELSQLLGFMVTKHMLKRFIKKNSVTVGDVCANV